MSLQTDERAQTYLETVFGGTERRLVVLSVYRVACPTEWKLRAGIHVEYVVAAEVIGESRTYAIVGYDLFAIIVNGFFAAD